MQKPRILLADGHPAMQYALRGLLEQLGEVVGVVGDGEALVEAAQRLEPDIILADISMPRLNGLEATRALQYSVPQSKVIILTSHHEAAYVTLAFESGARGYLLKRSSLHAELSQALLRVLAGDRYIGLGVREEGAFADEGETLTLYRL
jgi:DNA-binding NarL/FixJ family response regulator